MNDPAAQLGPDHKPVGPETPEDVAILFSWANLHGAKYRDFSASRREFRAQQRARVAEQQRDAELAVARSLEQTAQRELQEAQLLLEETRLAEAAAADAEVEKRAEEAFRRAEERAQLEQREAHRREQSAEELHLLAEKARSEMLEARKRADDQAARYAEFDAQYPSELAARPTRNIPGELADPYYYTGQVDPAYFAPTPGVRTAQAARTSTQRKAYQFPMHPGSEEFDSGTVGSYRPNTKFAPSPLPDYRPVARDTYGPPKGVETKGNGHAHGHALFSPYIERNSIPARVDEGPSTSKQGILPGLLETLKPSEGSSASRDLHIRPAARRIPGEAGPYDVPAVGVVLAPESTPSLSTIAAVQPESTKDEHLFALRTGMSPTVVTSPSPQGVMPPLEPEPAGAPESLPDTHARTFSPSHPPIADTSGEPPFRSMDRRSRSLRRRRDSLDKGARTTRQPRPESPLPGDEAMGAGDFSSPVPPAWFVQGDSPGAEDSPVPPRTEQPGNPPTLEAATPVPGTPLAQGTKTDRNAFSPDNDIPFAVRQILEQDAHVYPGRRKGNTLNRAAEISSFPRNEGSLPERYQEVESGAPSSSAAANLPDHASMNQARQPYPLPVDARAETSGNASLAPDTLQQSRERVASRWFALKGLMSASAEDPAALGASYETKSPALSVISLSGGVGKTSIVATIGRALSSLGETVLLADTNMHGMLPYHFGARDLRPGMVRTFTPPPGSTDAPVLLVNYEADGLDADREAQDRILDDLHRRSEGIQRVLLDLNSSHLWIARRMARLNPWILVPIAPDMNSVLATHTMERLFTGIVEANDRPVKPFYVLNQFDPALPLHLDVREVLRQSLGERLLPVMIHRSHTVPEALAEGMTVIDYAPESPVTEDFMNLAAWLRKLFAPVSSNAHGARWSER